jgi:hypothetical protein
MVGVEAVSDQLTDFPLGTYLAPSHPLTSLLRPTEPLAQAIDPRLGPQVYNGGWTLIDTRKR